MNRFLGLGGKALVVFVMLVVVIGLLLTWYDTVIDSTYLMTAGFIQATLVGILPPLAIFGAAAIIMLALFKRR